MHITRRKFLALLGGGLGMVTLGGCIENPLSPRTDYKGKITNRSRFKICEVIIDSKSYDLALMPGEVWIPPVRLEGGMKHTLYARTDDSRVFHDDATINVDDRTWEDPTYGTLGWKWDIGGGATP